MTGKEMVLAHGHLLEHAPQRGWMLDKYFTKRENLSSKFCVDRVLCCKLSA
jgi:hypothetical protein